MFSVPLKNQLIPSVFLEEFAQEQGEQRPVEQRCATVKAGRTRRLVEPIFYSYSIITWMKGLAPSRSLGRICRHAIQRLEIPPMMFAESNPTRNSVGGQLDASTH